MLDLLSLRAGLDPKFINKKQTLAIGKCLWMNEYGPGQGCQMVYFQTKKPKLGKFRRVLDWKLLICFIAIWNILQTFGTFYDHLVHFMTIWYILCPFGTFFRVLVSSTNKNLIFFHTLSLGT
jgi:hypothetical protein